MINHAFGPRIAFHSGYCCGIKIIHTLGNDPTRNVPEITEFQVGVDEDADQYGHTVSSDWNFYPNKAPSETAFERVERYVKYLDAVRPNGIIEIALAQDPDEDCPDPNQMEDWPPLLIPLGFKEVTSCYNSNSGCRIHVFHRTTDKTHG